MGWLRLLIFLFIVGLAEYYSYIVVRSSVRSLPGGWRTTIISFYFLLTAVAWLGFILFRVINWAELPHMLRNIYIAFALGLVVGKLLVLAVMLIDDFRRLATWVIGRFAYSPATMPDWAANGISRSDFFKQVALLLGAGALTGFIYGISNRYDYRIRKIKLKFDNLPQAFKGLKIVQLSDIHSGSFDNHKAVARGVEKVMKESPDLIFFTGDLVNNKADEMDGYKDIFSQLSAPLGVYSILGNHDYGDYVEWPSKQAKAENLNRLKSIHGEMGWKLLLNENVVLDRSGDRIAVLGVENWSSKGRFPRHGDMKAATSGLDGDIPFKILLSHDPSHWDAQILPLYKDIDLTLSGHTHGMQFGVEIPGFKWSPVKYMYDKWAGVYQTGKQYLYVNRGFGFLGYPGRLGILPEITVIELA